MTDEELKHFGTLGMKWGRRKAAQAAGFYQARAGALRKEGQTKAANAADRYATVFGARAKNIQRKLDNYNKFQSDLKALTKNKNPNDMDAIMAVCAKHDTAEAKRKADWKKAPKFTFKEKAYEALLGNPTIPKGERIAATALATAGVIGLAYLRTR